jgi:predicted enzyme related to lactoylglutathione lyase
MSTKKNSKKVPASIVWFEIPRMHPDHKITNYVLVDSVDKSAAKVKKLGGDICKPKTAVSGMGYFVICSDTENNTFALWEMNPKAK